MVDACASAGILPFYGPFGDIKDTEGCETQFRAAFLLGCVGAWSLHPVQIEIAKKVFSPPVDEVLFAKKVLEAIPDGKGVHMIDGKMQDDATWKQCKVMVDLAEMLAKKDPELTEAYELLVAPPCAFRHPLRVRFHECDPQGVVFNGNYLAYFDIAFTELWREAFGGWDEAMSEPRARRGRRRGQRALPRAAALRRGDRGRRHRDQPGRDLDDDAASRSSAPARPSPRASCATSSSTPRRGRSRRSRRHDPARARALRREHGRSDPHIVIAILRIWHQQPRLLKAIAACRRHHPGRARASGRTPRSPSIARLEREGANPAARDAREG